MAGGQTNESGLVGGDAVSIIPRRALGRRPDRWSSHAFGLNGGFRMDHVLVAERHVPGGHANQHLPGKRRDTYDPATNEWSPAGEMSTPRYSHFLVTLSTGQVVVFGAERAPIGRSFLDRDSFVREMESPGANTWRTVAVLPVPPIAGCRRCSWPMAASWLNGGRPAPHTPANSSADFALAERRWFTMNAKLLIVEDRHAPVRTSLRDYPHTRGSRGICTNRRGGIDLTRTRPARPPTSSLDVQLPHKDGLKGMSRR